MGSEKTQKKIENVGNKAANKAEQALAEYGVNVDLKNQFNNIAAAGAPQGDAMKKELNTKLNELATQFGGMSMGDIQKALAARVNKEIDNAEKSSPDGVKGAMDVGQRFLNALFKAGGDAMGQNADLTLNGIANSASRAINGKGVHNAIKKANQSI